MSKQFSYWLPDWMHNHLPRKACSQCGHQYSRNDITAVGIRSLDKKTQDCTAYIEHECSACGFRSLSPLNKQKENSMEEICCNLLEHIKKKKQVEKSISMREQPKGPMTNQEIKKFLKFINKAQSHEEFLKEIGVSPPKDPHDSR